MKINKRAKAVIAAAALIGTAGIAGTAFTATGIERTAPATQFVGGTVNQTVTGAVLSNIEYGFADDTHMDVDEIKITFTDGAADTQSVDVTLSGADTATFTCG